MNELDQLDINLRDHEGYSAAWAKLQELRGEFSEIDLQVNNFLTAMSTHRTDDVRDQRIARLVGDRSQPVVLPEVNNARLNELRRHRSDLRSAIQEMERRVAEAQAAASAEICERVRVEHDRLAREICHSLIKAHASMKKYGALIDLLNDQQVYWTGHLRPSFARMLGDPNDTTSRLATYLSDAADHGIISYEEIPDCIRPPPEVRRGYSKQSAATSAPVTLGRRLRRLVAADNQDVEWSATA